MLSRKNKDVLEVSAVPTYSVMRAYCSQDLLIEPTKGRLKELYLTPERWETVLASLDPHDTEIRWTGFVEPCLNRFLPDMCVSAERLGFVVQRISTTLVGHKEVINWLINSKLFESVTLHLPDSSGLMEKGDLRVNKKYCDRVEQALQIKTKGGNTDNVLALTFVAGFHKKIKALVQNAATERNVQVQKTIELHSRSRLIDISLLGSNFKVIKEVMKKIRIKIASEVSGYKSGFYCRCRRLNQPVMLGSGELQICCLDNGLTTKVGNLIKEQSTLNTQLARWWEENSSTFTKGEHGLCKNYEYYHQIGTKEYLKYAYKNAEEQCFAY